MSSDFSQKGQSVAARLAKLPVVRSACVRLSVLYTDTKCSHPSLMSVCEGLETRVTALASPVIVKLEPQSKFSQGSHVRRYCHTGTGLHPASVSSLESNCETKKLITEKKIAAGEPTK